ncbi:MAG: Ig-like domain-containing protein, partial [Alistipes sp.]|nr:Ig-like domain-containing protein [Alistipes sp.]
EITVSRQLAEELTLNHAEATLYSGETIALQAAILPTTTTNQAVQWSSSNESVATVNQEGLVSALTTGTTTIAATTLDGSNLVAQCVITVKQHVTAITLSSSALELKLGQSHTLQATLDPSNATNTNFTVVSSNTTVATVHQDGEMIVVNGIGEGSATITATTEDGGLTAECNVSVTSWPQTPSHLSLAVQKDGVRYFIPQADYSEAFFAEYTKEGVALISESGSFILALDDLSTDRLPQSNASSRGKLPTKAQAEVITANWALVDAAIATFGGTPMSDKTYWTASFSHTKKNQGSGNGTQLLYVTFYFCYNATEVSYSAQSNYLYAREIIATL